MGDLCLLRNWPDVRLSICPPFPERHSFPSLMIAPVPLLAHINDTIVPASISTHSARLSAIPSQFCRPRCIHNERTPIRCLPYYCAASTTLLHNPAGKRKGRCYRCRRYSIPVPRIASELPCDVERGKCCCACEWTLIGRWNWATIESSPEIEQESF